MTYTVSAAEFVKELPGKGDRGPLNIFKLTLDTGGSSFPNVEMLQKPETPAPEVGQKLEGQIQQTDFGPRFRKAQQGQGGGTRQGGAKDFKADPRKQRAIQRESAQKQAVSLFDTLLRHGVLTSDKLMNEDGTFKAGALKPLIEWFDKDISDVVAEVKS